MAQDYFISDTGWSIMILYVFQELEVKELTETFNQLKVAIVNEETISLGDDSVSSELAELTTLNIKLKHRLAILKRVS